MNPFEYSNSIISNPEIINISTVQILTSRSYCKICKDERSLENLIEICQCSISVHQRCISQEIDRWIEENELEKISQITKPYLCEDCGMQIHFKQKRQIHCRNSKQIYAFYKQNQCYSITSLFLLIVGITILIVVSLIKTNQIIVDILDNGMLKSALIFAIIVVTCFMILIAIYMIVVEMMIRAKNKVGKVYQKIRKSSRKVSEPRKS